MAKIDLSKMTEKDLIVLRNDASDAINGIRINRVSAVKPHILCRLKKKLRHFVEIGLAYTDNRPFGHIKVTIDVPVLLNCENDDFYIDPDLDSAISNDFNEEVIQAVIDSKSLNIRLNKVQREYNEFLDDMKKMAKTNGIDLDDLWDLVDPKGSWH